MEYQNINNKKSVEFALNRFFIKEKIHLFNNTF
jgi:hypothetical protein